jgi:Fic-DOC domain mobile mystery protein B
LELKKVSSLELEYPPGATPLSEEEKQGLIPSHINTHGELNDAEQANIVSARVWAMGKNHRDLLSDEFMKRLHKKMFKDVWKWAGKHRRSAKNIGVDWHNITTEVKKLCDDVNYWIRHNAYANWDELGARFHHRLICIHPFPNGNGRHARIMTDLLLKQNGQAVFTWGALSSGEEVGRGKYDVRQQYLDALRAADNKNCKKLIEFVRS